MLLGKNKHSQIITGLDIGTTKVCAIIGQADPEGNLTILGVASCPSKGLQRGEIIEIQPTVDAIIRATNQAMEIAGVQIGDLYVGIAGEHIQSKNTSASIDIRHPRRGIDEKDRRRAVDKAIDIAVPEDQAIINTIVQEFRVNGKPRIRNPIGLSGSNLEVHTHLVLSCVDSLNNILKCVQQAGFRQPQVVLQSLASSMSVISTHELELGNIMIDIGGGTTDVAISVDGAIRETCEIGIAGDRITRDIAEILNCSLNDAENAKKRFGCAIPDMVERGRTFELPMAGDLRRMTTHEEYLLARIIEARLEDIFDVVSQYLAKSAYKNHLHAGIILTGGTALLQGITDVAERILEMKCRTGIPQGLKGFAPVVTSPIYSTGVGLILYGMQVQQQESNYRRGRVRRLLDYLIETFIL